MPINISLKQKIQPLISKRSFPDLGPIYVPRQDFPLNFSKQIFLLINHSVKKAEISETQSIWFIFQDTVAYKRQGYKNMCTLRRKRLSELRTSCAR